MDITVDDFLDLCDQKCSCQNVSNSQQLLWYECVLILVNALQRTVRTTRAVVLHVTWLWTAEGQCTQIPDFSLNFHTCYSHLRSITGCNKGLDFWYPATSTGHCKFKAVSFTKVNSDTGRIMWCVYYHIPSLSSNPYLLFQVFSGHNSIGIQNRTRVYELFFNHKNLGNHLKSWPQLMKHPVYYE